MREWRLAAVAALGALVVLVGSGTTEARWSAGDSIQGSTLHTGSIDLRVDGQDAISGFAPFSLTDLEPGGGAAHLLTVRNAGTVPMTWSASLATTGTNGLDTALTTRVTDATSTDGSTCGGSALSGSSTLQPGDSATVCVQVSLPAGAPASVAGSTADPVLTARGTTTRGDWPDTADVTGTHVTTVALTPPTISCQGTLTVGWSAVPGATGYRVFLAGVQVAQLGPDTLTATLGMAGLVTVRAVFGSDTWVSPDSNGVTLPVTGC